MYSEYIKCSVVNLKNSKKKKILSLTKCFTCAPPLLQTEARETIPRMLAELDLGRTEKCVRVNSVSSGLAEADLQVILQAEVLPPAIMLPKVEDAQEVQWVSYNYLTTIECFYSITNVRECLLELSENVKSPLLKYPN